MPVTSRRSQGRREYNGETVWKKADGAGIDSRRVRKSAVQRRYIKEDDPA